jgi:hypothetical protein
MSRVRSRWSLATIMVFAAAASLGAGSARARAVSSFGRLPLEFYAAPASSAGARLLAQGPGYQLTLGAGGMRLRLAGKERGGAHHQRTLSMFPVGARPAKLQPVRRLAGVMNIYAGHERRSWRTGLPTYAAVRERGLWPGVDALFDGSAGRLEYDFRLAPGASVRRLVLRFSGMDRIALDAHGDLVLEIHGTRVLQRAPRAWQVLRGRRVSVPVHWALRSGGRAAIRVGRYDHARPLVIDPQLVYSTYTGRGGVFGMAAGSDGSPYVMGGTTTGYYVQHLNAAGTAALFTSTFTYANGYAIAVDGSGDAYVTGTAGSGYPTTAGAYESSSQIPGCSDPTSANAAFLTELSPSGTVDASTMLGASTVGGAEVCGGGVGAAVALDGAGNAYVAMSTFEESGALPITPGTYEQTPASYGQSLGVAKVDLHNQGAAQLVWGTYAGPGGSQTISGIAVDAAGEPVIVGTETMNFSLGGSGQNSPYQPPGHYTPPNQPPAVAASGFVEKFNATATEQLWSSQVLTSFDTLNAVTYDSAGNVFVAGTILPQQLGICPQQTDTQATYCPLVAKLTSSGATAWTKVLTGTDDQGIGIAVDSSDDAFVTGQTGSATFPTTAGAMQTQNAGGEDAFLTELDPTGTILKYSTYLGGPGDDSGHALALAPNGDALVAGAAAPGFPTTAGAYNTTGNGGDGGFVSEVVPVNAPAASTGSATSLTQTSATLNGTVDPDGPTASYHFEYGTSAAYGSSTESTIASTSGAVSAEIEPLLPGMTYHFRLVATTAGGESDGVDQTFTTQQATYSGPTITQAPANVTVVAGQAATFTAQATAVGGQTPLRRWQESFDGGVNFSQLDPLDGVQCVSSTATLVTDETALSTGADNGASCAAGDTAYGGTGLALPDSLADNGLQFEVSFETYPPDQTVTSDPATLTVIAPPTVTTGAADFLGSATATLTGTVNPNGADTTDHFEYGTTTSYTQSTPALDAGAGRAGLSVSASLSGLKPDTTYHYELVASNSPGPASGADQTFATPAASAKPAVTTSAPTAITASGATLHGTVDPNNAETTYAFDYGPSSSYGTFTASTQLLPAGGAEPVSASLTGLSAGTEYHYALVAINQLGSSTTADGTFTTAATGAGPGPGTGSGPAPGSGGKARPPRITIADGRASVAHDRAAVKLSCSGSRGTICRGRLTITLRERIRVRIHGHLRGEKVTVTLGRAAYAVRAGHTALVSVRLSRGAGLLLARARGHRLKVGATARDSGSAKRATRTIALELKRKTKAR